MDLVLCIQIKNLASHRRSLRLCDVNGDRAAQSAKKYGKNDPWVSTKKIIAPDRKTAYGIEHVRIEMNGRAGNISKNYYKRNSPGLKILKAIFK